jgi:hypothetical protein
VQLPFAHLNLRYNPFGELPLTERPALAILDPEPYLELLSAPRAALQFMGDKGRGKTTHLLTLRAHRPGPYLHLPEEGPLPEVPLTEPLLYLDETQRLPRRVRKALYRGPSRLVLGAHQDHERELRRAGRPVMTVHVGAALDVERLGQIVVRRIEAARRAPGPVPEVPQESLISLLDRFGDDLRAIEHHLYERVQALEEPCHVQV